MRMPKIKRWEDIPSEFKKILIARGITSESAEKIYLQEVEQWTVITKDGQQVGYTPPELVEANQRWMAMLRVM